jgi:hypothetical protein
MHNLLVSLTERGIKVPESARTVGQLKKLDAMDRRGKASGDEFMTDVLARRGKNSRPSDGNNMPVTKTDREYQRHENNNASDLENQGRENLDPSGDPLETIYSEVASRTKAPARPGSPTRFTRAAPETERKQIAYRQGDERKTMRQDGDPYKVAESKYADNVPNIEDDPRHTNQKQGVDDIEEAIRLLTGGKLAGNANDMATLLALRQQERGNMSGLVREQHMEGQRFSDLQPGRRGQGVGSSEGSAIDNQAALDQQALAEYLSSMRSGE